MADFVVTDAAFAGLRLLLRRPLATIAWASICVAPLGAIVFLLRPGGPVGGLVVFYGAFLSGLLVVSTLVAGAVFRAVLEPVDSAFAFLRVGSRELALAPVLLARAVLMIVLQILLAIPLDGLIAVLGANDPGVAVLLSVVGRMAIFGVVVWVRLRLSLAGPMTFSEGRFRLFESWALTRRHGWRLFLVALLVAPLCLLAVAVAIIGGLAIARALWGVAPSAAILQGFVSHPLTAWLSAPAALSALVAILLVLAGAIIIPIFIAPWAHIYRRLEPDGGDLAPLNGDRPVS